jgi:electron transfer flavoprotein beta subunit
MKIAVCVKQVPDTWAEKTLRAEDSTLDRESPDGVLNELDEYAVEEALQIAEAHGGEVTVVSMGPARAAETSAVLAAALADKGFDIIVFGSESTDARMSVVPAMVAERLGIAQLTFAQRVSVLGSDVTIERVTDYGFDTITAQMPVVVSVVEKINEPRYPSFKGIMAAKKKPVETLGIADLGIDAAVVGQGAAWTAVADFSARPAKPAGTIVADAGDGGARIAAYLTEQKFI